jgi:hypothetical protein
MNQSRRKLFLALCLAGVVNHSRAAEHESQQVRSTLKKIFDKPAKPLAVDAVAVSGKFSLASWSQGEKAGRALLRMKNGQWEIVVCGGKDLKQVSALAKAGVPPSDSELLVSDLSKAELKLPVSLQKRFDSFALESQRNHKGRE